jgi:hypothetical protein
LIGTIVCLSAHPPGVVNDASADWSPGGCYGPGLAYLWWRRRALRLTTGRSVSASRSSSVPAFLPNLVRKITALESIQADGAQVLVATAAADVKTEFLSRLESRTEELIEETGPDDPAQAHLRAYLATVRGAR